MRAALAQSMDVSVDRLTNDARLVRDFGADSIDVVEVAMDIEDEFGIVLPSEWYDKADPTVGEYIEAVERAAEG